MSYFTCNSPLLFAVDITNKCNFNCLHCYNNSGEGKKAELTDDEFINLANQIAEFEPLSLCFCGGETLLRYNLIIKMLDIFRGKVGIVNLVTNGYLLTKEKAINLKKHGLTGLQISLDGYQSIQHDSFRGYRGAFEHALNAIDYAKAAGLQVGVAISPSKINILDIENIFELAVKHEVSEIRLMPIIGMGRANRMKHLLLNSNEYANLLDIIFTYKQKLLGLNINLEWGDPIDHIYRMQSNDKIGMYTYSMEIKSDGNIGASTYFPIYFGNIREHSLKEYWEAGFNRIWGNKKFLRYINKIETIADIENFYQQCKEDIVYDLIDD